MLHQYVRFCLGLGTALLCCWQPAAAQAPTTRWNFAFGGVADDRLTALQPTADGGCILGGTSSSGQSGSHSQPSFGASDYWVVKLDAAGLKVWDRKFGGTGDDRLTSLQQTADGGYILGGSSNSGISGNKSQASRGGLDMWVVKIDGQGGKVWDRT